MDKWACKLIRQSGILAVVLILGNQRTEDTESEFAGACTRFLFNFVLVLRFSSHGERSLDELS
jgi:hypothetical protein